MNYFSRHALYSHTHIQNYTNWDGEDGLQDTAPAPRIFPTKRNHYYALVRGQTFVIARRTLVVSFYVTDGSHGSIHGWTFAISVCLAFAPILLQKYRLSHTLLLRSAANHSNARQARRQPMVEKGPGGVGRGKRRALLSHRVQTHTHAHMHTTQIYTFADRWSNRMVDEDFFLVLLSSRTFMLGKIEQQTGRQKTR